MENEFVPINISESSNLDKKIFDDLTPCYSTGIIGGLYGNVNDNDSSNNNNCFSILGQ